MNITVNESDIGYTTPLLPSFCVDFYRDVFTGNTDLPYSMEPLSLGLAGDSNVKNPQNAGEIAYLYNHFGSTWSTNPSSYVPVAEAVGFQLAVWELEYETSGTNNVLNGSFFAQGLTPTSAEVTYAQNFLSEAQGKSELAVYLNGLPPANGPNGSQGLIAPESLNFTNGPESKTVPSVGTAIENSATNSPPPAGGDALGATVYDTATVTGPASGPTPTGTVTYYFFDTAMPVFGTTIPVSSQVVNISGGLVPNSATSAALTAGSYSYIALYSGDSNYDPVIGRVEPVTVNQGTPSGSTTIHDSAGGAVTGTLGEKVYDTATVTGTPVTPTGTLTYNFYTTATPVYGTTTPSSTQTVTLTAAGAVPNSDTTAALTTGGYSYIADYSGDSNYKGFVGTIEHLTVNQAAPNVSTTIFDSAGGAVTGTLGEKVYDTATVTGTPVTPTGTLTYNLYTTATPVYGTTTPSSTQTVTLTAAGTVPNSDTTAALTAGGYSYIAVYSGDSNYKGFVGVIEPLTVKQPAPSVSTMILDSSGAPVTGLENEMVYDTATVTGTPLTPTGTVTYYFYTTLSPVYGTTTPTSTQTVTLTSTGTVPNSATTGALALGSYSYIAVYSGDANYKGAVGSAEPLLIITPVPPHVTTSIDGTVFCDCNDNGIQDNGETGISDVTLTLTGVDNTGHAVNMVTTTNSLGAYDFNSLSPGTYSITESPPSGYFEGKNTAGTAGGTVTGDVISGITLAAGINATGYNFADITPSTISGAVYYDYKHNPADNFGIAHVAITLEGTDDLGQSVQMTAMTNNDGDYSFGDLRPGTYNLTETPPSIFLSGTNTAGSLGGTVSKNGISDIPVPGCATAVDYLFTLNPKPNCNLPDLALHVGNVFYHFERTYQRDPVAFAKQYPNLTPSIAAGQVPWGKAPFPRAPVASYWVPTLGTKPIKIFPVHGNLKLHPLVATTPTTSAVSKPAIVHSTSSKADTVHTPSVRTTVSKPAIVHSTSPKVDTVHTPSVRTTAVRKGLR